MRLAGESACPTTGRSFACIGGTGFSLSTPACGRIFLTFRGRVSLPATCAVLCTTMAFGVPVPKYAYAQTLRGDLRRRPHGGLSLRTRCRPSSGFPGQADLENAAD